MPDAVTYFLSYSEYYEIFVKTDGVIFAEIIADLAACIYVFSAVLR